jgi:hypothetical protein
MANEGNEIVEISVERNIENLEREVVMYEKNIKLHEDLLERLDVEEASIAKRYEIMLKPENFKILRPVWQYETLPEYVETIRVDVENRKLNDEHQITQTRDQLTKVLGHQQDAYDSVVSELARLKGETKE